MNTKLFLLTTLFSGTILIQGGNAMPFNNSLASADQEVNKRNLVPVRRSNRIKKPNQRLFFSTPCEKKQKRSTKEVSHSVKSFRVTKDSIIKSIMDENHRALFQEFYNNHQQMFLGNDSKNETNHINEIVTLLNKNPVLFDSLKEIRDLNATLVNFNIYPSISLVSLITMINQYLIDKEDDTLCFNVDKMFDMSWQTLYYFFPKDTPLKTQIETLSTLYSIAASQFPMPQEEDYKAKENFYKNVFKLAIRIYAAFAEYEQLEDDDLYTVTTQRPEQTIQLLSVIITQIHNLNFINQDNIEPLIHFIDETSISKYFTNYNKKNLPHNLNYNPEKAVDNINNPLLTIITIPEMLKKLKNIAHFISLFDNDVDTFLSLFNTTLNHTNNNLMSSLSILHNIALNYKYNLERNVKADINPQIKKVYNFHNSNLMKCLNKSKNLSTTKKHKLEILYKLSLVNPDLFVTSIYDTVEESPALKTLDQADAKTETPEFFLSVYDMILESNDSELLDQLDTEDDTKIKRSMILKNKYLTLLNTPKVIFSYLSFDFPKERFQQLHKDYIFFLNSLLIFISPIEIIEKIISEKFNTEFFHIDLAKFNELNNNKLLDITQDNMFSYIFDAVNTYTKIFGKKLSKEANMLSETLNALNTDNTTKNILLKHFLRFFESFKESIHREKKNFIYDFANYLKDSIFTDQSYLKILNLFAFESDNFATLKTSINKIKDVLFRNNDLRLLSSPKFFIKYYQIAKAILSKSNQKLHINDYIISYATFIDYIRSTFAEKTFPKMQQIIQKSINDLTPDEEEFLKTYYISHIKNQLNLYNTTNELIPTINDPETKYTVRQEMNHILSQYIALAQQYKIDNLAAYFNIQNMTNAEKCNYILPLIRQSGISLIKTIKDCIHFLVRTETFSNTTNQIVNNIIKIAQSLAGKPQLQQNNDLKVFFEFINNTSQLLKTSFAKTPNTVLYRNKCIAFSIAASALNSYFKTADNKCSISTFQESNTPLTNMLKFLCATNLISNEKIDESSDKTLDDLISGIHYLTPVNDLINIITNVINKSNLEDYSDEQKNNFINFLTIILNFNFIV